ncbi:MAG: hypothetical protein U9O94_06295 [Nanoarchaeota archaeon]|nr:hypothetical protein [Nanoarchaeota archaeon]
MKINKTQIEYITKRFDEKFEEKLAEWKIKNPTVPEANIGWHSDDAQTALLYSLIQKYTSIVLIPLEDIRESDLKDLVRCINYPKLTKAITAQNKLAEAYEKKAKIFADTEKAKIAVAMDKIILGGEAFATILADY